MKVLTATAIVAVGAVGALLITSRDTAPPGDGPVITRAESREEDDQILADVTYQMGPTFDAGLKVRPAGDAGQTKLWTHDGRWWGVLLAGEEHRIHSFDPDGGWSDTGVLVDGRVSAHVDAVAEGATVTTISAGESASERNAVEVRQFFYDSGARLYRAAPGFPVRVNETGARSVRLARAGDGTLWAAFIVEQQVLVASTAGGDRDWSDPAPVPTPAASEPSDTVAIAANDERVALLWATTDGAFFSATTSGGSPWVEELLVDGAAEATEPVVALRAHPDGTSFIGILEIERPEGKDDNPISPHIVVVTGDGEGDSRWRMFEVSREEDHMTEPTLAIDAERNLVFVLAAAEGSIWAKTAPLDAPAFPTGRGRVLIAADVGGTFDEVTTASVYEPDLGILALAADNGTGRYAHGMSRVPPVAAPTGQVDTTNVLDEPFDGSPASGPPEGWELSSGAGTGELAIVAGRTGNALRLTSTTGDDARACRRFTLGAPAPFTAGLSFQFNGSGTGDAAVLSIRAATEVVSVRVDEEGRIGWYDGDLKVRTDKSVAPASWYRAEARVDPATRTYSVRLAGDDGATIASGEGVKWRAQEASGFGEICVTTREGVGAATTIDDVTVRK